MKARDIARHELIGLKVEIVESSNPSHVGVSGKVVDETRQMLILETKNGVKSFPKDACVFHFFLPSGKSVKVDGKLLVARPEDRVKKKLKKW